MIPIFAAPKRFVAALGRGRRRGEQFIPKNGLRRFNSSITRTIVNTSQFSTAVNTSSVISEGVLINSRDPIAIGNEFANKGSRFCSNSLEIQPIVLNLFGPRGSQWYTGKIPISGVCPGVQRDGTIQSLPQISWKKSFTRQQLQDYFDNTWAMTELLLGGLQGEEAFMRPPTHELRHPMIFYYGHPAALYVNKLRVAGLMSEPINPLFEVLFETGVDEMSWDDLSKNAMKWPSVSDVHVYRRQVYQAVSDVISSLSDHELSTMSRESPLWALVMGFEHERIHLETSSVLMSELPIEYVKFPQGFPSYHPSTQDTSEIVRDPVAGVHYPAPEMVPVQAQAITLGKPADAPSFGWDNEYGRRTFDVPAFAASKYKTTNGEYLEFVREGGYARKELWTEAGWKWRAFRNAKWPFFWVREGPQGLNHFRLRLIFDEVPMQWDWPVSVNQHEASAFAKWKSLTTGRNMRVSTELEHNAMRNPSQQSGSGEEVDHVVAVKGNMMVEMGVNTNLSCASMSPVDALPANEKGFHDLFGNAWEWTNDYFCALPGFEVHPLYEDFSTPCFDGLHHLIMGGSFISTGDEASIYSRFHFRPHFLQHASFRLVEPASASEPMLTSDTDAPGPYVGDYPFRRSQRGLTDALSDTKNKADAFNGQMSRHFGAVAQAFQLASELRSPSETLKETVMAAMTAQNLDIQDSRILEVGCGPGGLSFELAKQGAKLVMGIDHSHEDITTARQLFKQSAVEYSLRGEGDSRAAASVRVDGLDPSTVVDFRCADPMCLPAELQGFDVVVLNDVIDKISSPNSLLGRMGGMRGLVGKGGLLVVLTTFSWSEQTTPRSLWITGSPSNGGSTTSFATSEEALAKRLSPDFEFIGKAKVPVFWQESASDLRGKLYSVTQWKRI